MIVRRADTMGVCMGVRRALAMVEDVLRENPGVPVSTLGPLIHNRRVVEESCPSRSRRRWPAGSS